MSYSGSRWTNPSDLSCFKACQSCFRCEDKGTKSMCNRCSGRHDPEMKKDPYDTEDQCRCREGLLQYRVKSGQLIKTELKRDPFGGTIETHNAVTEDEKEWEDYLQSERERRNDASWDPVTIEGESATDKFRRD